MAPSLSGHCTNLEIVGNTVVIENAVLLARGNWNADRSIGTKTRKRLAFPICGCGLYTQLCYTSFKACEGH